MKKNISGRTAATPVTVLIVGSFDRNESILDETGHIDYDKLHPIYYDSEPRSYREIAGIIGKAFHDGAKLKL